MEVAKPIAFKAAKKEFEYQYVSRLLYYTKGNVSKAAKIAEKDRKDFYYLMKRAGVDSKRFKHND